MSTEEMIVPRGAPAGFWESRSDPPWSRSSPPCVWHPDYSVPWPAKHRFAMWKFDDLRHELVRSRVVGSELEFFSPRDEVGDSSLDAAIRLAHDEEYVARTEDGTLDATLWRRVGFTSRPDHASLVRRTRLEVAGTLLAAELALQHGLCCHLAGGTHHAHRAYGAGYTMFNDLAIAALEHLRRGRDRRVLVVDMDVHQGDGTAEILRGAPNAFTWSVHCSDNYPFGFDRRHAPYLGNDRSSLDSGLPKGSGDVEALAIVNDVLPKLLDDFSPTLVLFDAGADAHESDGLGHLKLTDAGIATRDATVLRECASRHIPLVTVIGGGYDRDRDRLARRHASVFHSARQVWRERHERTYEAE